MTFRRRIMDLASLAETLPNGFHDAFLGTLTFDFRDNTATLILRVLTSTPDDTPEKGNVYRLAKVQLRDVFAFAFTGASRSSSWSDAWVEVEGYVPSIDKLKNYPVFESVKCPNIYGFFLHEWNESLFLASQHADLSWIE
jgi:hypothetical protein